MDFCFGVGDIYLGAVVGVNIKYVFVAVISFVGVLVGVFVKVGVSVMTGGSFEDKSGGFVNVG